MNVIQKTTIALVALSAASLSAAQPAPAANSNGLLGQRYAEASFGVIDPHGISRNAYGLDFAANVPVTTYADLGFNYGYGWTKIGGVKTHANSIDATAKAYTTLAGVKTFAGAGVGRTWVKSRARTNFNTWGLTVGAELQAGDITVTPSIAYTDLLNNRSGGEYSYSVEGSTWVTKTLAGFLGVAFSDSVGRGSESWNYTFGIRSKF